MGSDLDQLWGAMLGAVILALVLGLAVVATPVVSSSASRHTSPIASTGIVRKDLERLARWRDSKSSTGRHASGQRESLTEARGRRVR